jgi:hypothetical protein
MTSRAASELALRFSEPREVVSALPSRHARAVGRFGRQVFPEAVRHVLDRLHADTSMAQPLIQSLTAPLRVVKAEPRVAIPIPDSWVLVLPWNLVFHQAERKMLLQPQFLGPVDPLCAFIWPITAVEDRTEERLAAGIALVERNRSSEF